MDYFYYSQKKYFMGSVSDLEKSTKFLQTNNRSNLMILFFFCENYHEIEKMQKCNNSDKNQQIG